MSSTRPKRIRRTSEQELDLDELQTLADAATDHPSAWIRLANAFEASGQISRALDAWRQAALLVPNSDLVSGAIARLRRLISDDHSGSSREAPADRGPAETAEPTSDSPDSPDDPDSEKPHETLLDIDALITDLQSGRRKPTVDLSEVEEAHDQTQGADTVISETLARIYESQNHFSEAVAIYEKLADRETDAEKADILRARATDLRKKISKSG